MRQEPPYEAVANLRDQLAALRAENARLNDRLTACETETVLLREERDRQYDENVNRIAKEGAAELRADKAEAENERLRQALTWIAHTYAHQGSMKPLPAIDYQDHARAALSQNEEPK